MIVEAKITINGPKSAVWAAITDIEGAAQIVRGIEAIEVVEKAPSGIIGLRWRETRILFGKPATVEKWITDAAEQAFYTTRAESDGFVFLTTLRISEDAGGVTLTSAHESKPQTMRAKLSLPMLLLFRGVLRKAILQDLEDLKAAVERPSRPAEAVPKA